MSIRALNWVVKDVSNRNDVAPTMRFILLVLANFANEEHKTHPFQSTIARITGLDRSTVNVNLGKLEAAGLITKTNRFHESGGKRSSEYLLHLPHDPDWPNFSDDTPSPPSKSKGDVAQSNKGDVAQSNKGDVDEDNKGMSDDPTWFAVQDNNPGCAGQQGLLDSTTRDVGEDNILNLKQDTQAVPKANLKRVTKKNRGSAAPWPEDAWDQFWSLYPNKTAKKAAQASFDKLAQAGELEFAELMEGLRFYANKDDFREWCMPSTWLNQGRWEDRPPQKATVDPTKIDRSRMKFAI